MKELQTFHTEMVAHMAIQNCAVAVDYCGKVTRRLFNDVSFDIGCINLEAQIAFDISTTCGQMTHHSIICITFLTFRILIVK